MIVVEHIMLVVSLTCDSGEAYYSPGSLDLYPGKIHNKLFSG